MSKGKGKDEMREEYRREDLGRGVRGKYLARVSRGTNLVVLDEKVAKAFPSSEAVNKALSALMSVTVEPVQASKRPNGRTKVRR